jgi:hypothetical protein
VAAHPARPGVLKLLSGVNVANGFDMTPTLTGQARASSDEPRQA